MIHFQSNTARSTVQMHVRTQIPTYVGAHTTVFVYWKLKFYRDLEQLHYELELKTKIPEAK